MTTVEVRPSGLPTPMVDLDPVDGLSCPSESYDDLRTLLTGRLAP
ncbi:MAG TPA: hypothetical protein VF516_46375 [Kofleriaceae bacterium]